MNELER